MDFEDVWQTIGILLVLFAATTAGLFIFSPHQVKSYYLTHGSSTSPNICVNAYKTWSPDEVAFCTNNYQEAVDFATKANALVK